jgi:hypothetical protein
MNINMNMNGMTRFLSRRDKKAKTGPVKVSLTLH